MASAENSPKLLGHGTKRHNLLTCATKGLDKSEDTESKAADDEDRCPKPFSVRQKRIIAPSSWKTREKKRKSIQMISFCPNDIVSLMIGWIRVGQPQLMDGMNGDICMRPHGQPLSRSPDQNLLLSRKTSIALLWKQMAYAYHLLGPETSPSYVKDSCQVGLYV